jgi:hypothetical protein
MAHHLHKHHEHEESKADHDCLSSAGVIKLQQSNKKGIGTWRSLQTGDLGDLVHSNCEVSFQILDAKDPNSQLPAVDSALHHSLNKSRARPSVPPQTATAQNQLDEVYKGINAVKDHARHAQTDSEMHRATEEPQMQIFGKLPDPIRLHENMGRFDGQVVFIGHPNRDISAHQWSLSSFQWVNIGRYVHSSGKVEGSVASDCVRGVDETRDTLQHFKLAAEKRETLIIENGRPEEHKPASERVMYVVTDNTTSPSAHCDISVEHLQVSVDTNREIRISSSPMIHYQALEGPLEDPFVAAAEPSQPRFEDDNHTQDRLMRSTGSLDLAYQFPTQGKKISPHTLATKTEEIGVERRGFFPLSALTLPEINFGEEASIECSDTAGHIEQLLQRPSIAPLRTAHGGQQLTGNARAFRLTTSVQEGLTSSLSATAVPYTNTTIATANSGTLQFNASNVNAKTAGLHYSDPDGLRKTQRYEVANGLSQQVPTGQNFKGPFFAESHPTTHDPTVALSVRVSEEEKLVNWFRDGHRPARQRDYTKSLVAAAATSNKPRCFGPIGHAFSWQQKGPYANTGPFVRLYENLSEYVEEYRNGSGQSYFTRVWKPAPPQHRDTGRGEDRSYFGKRSNAPLLPKGGLFLRPSDHVWG